jgi:hypothetical protein
MMQTKSSCSLTGMFTIQFVVSVFSCSQLFNSFIATLCVCLQLWRDFAVRGGKDTRALSPIWSPCGVFCWGFLLAWWGAGIQVPLCPTGETVSEFWR